MERMFGVCILNVDRRVFHVLALRGEYRYVLAEGYLKLKGKLGETHTC